MRVAIVTGASSGMGYEFVQLLDKDQSVDELWLVARRENRLAELQKVCTKPCRCFALDLLDNSSYTVIKDALSGHEITWLVNAAGFGKIGSVNQNSEKEIQDMITLNVTSLTLLTKICLSFCKKGSHIVQFASSAAFFPQPDFAVYAATKSYVLSFSRALRKEVKELGIQVTTVCPGPVKTEFFDVAETSKKMAEYKKKFMVNSKDVVALAYRDALANKSVSVYGTSMKLVRFLAKVIPTDLVMKFY